MPSLVTIQQLPPDASENLFGLEKYGKSKFPRCTSQMEIPIVNGKHKLGLTDEQEEDFAQYFVNNSRTSLAWKTWLNDYVYTAPYDQKVLDLSTKEDQFAYQVFIKGNPQLAFIASSKKQAEEQSLTGYKYVVINEVEDEVEVVSVQKTKNKARAKLVEIQDDELEILKIAHYLFPVRGITTSTSAYKTIDSFIAESKDNALKFLSAFNVDAETMDVTVTVKRAVEKNILRRGQDNYYYNHASGNRIGRNVDEMVDYLSDPRNADEIGTGSINDSPITVKKQLRDKEL